VPDNTSGGHRAHHGGWAGQICAMPFFSFPFTSCFSFLPSFSFSVSQFPSQQHTGTHLWTCASRALSVVSHVLCGGDDCLHTTLGRLSHFICPVGFGLGGDFPLRSLARLALGIGMYTQVDLGQRMVVFVAAFSASEGLVEGCRRDCIRASWHGDLIIIAQHMVGGDRYIRHDGRGARYIRNHGHGCQCIYTYR